MVSVHVRDEAHPEQLLRQHMQLDVEPEPWGAFTTFQHRGMFAGSKDQKLADGGHLNPSRASGWLQTGEAWHMQDLALPSQAQYSLANNALMMPEAHRSVQPPGPPYQGTVSSEAGMMRKTKPSFRGNPTYT